MVKYDIDDLNKFKNDINDCFQKIIDSVYDYGTELENIQSILHTPTSIPMTDSFYKYVEDIYGYVTKLNEDNVSSLNTIIEYYQNQERGIGRGVGNDK